MSAFARLTSIRGAFYALQYARNIGAPPAALHHYTRMLLKRVNRVDCPAMRSITFRMLNASRVAANKGIAL